MCRSVSVEPCKCIANCITKKLRTRAIVEPGAKCVPVLLQKSFLRCWPRLASTYTVCVLRPQRLVRLRLLRSHSLPSFPVPRLLVADQNGNRSPRQHHGMQERLSPQPEFGQGSVLLFPGQTHEHPGRGSCL